MMKRHPWLLGGAPDECDTRGSLKYEDSVDGKIEVSVDHLRR